MLWALMASLTGEHDAALKLAERALDYTYRVKENYLGHEDDRREGDFKSAREFLDAGIEAVSGIPVTLYNERISNIMNALKREYVVVNERLRCFDVRRN